jgi:hypothetical protein
MELGIFLAIAMAACLLLVSLWMWAWTLLSCVTIAWAMITGVLLIPFQRSNPSWKHDRLQSPTNTKWPVAGSITKGEFPITIGVSPCHTCGKGVDDCSGLPCPHCGGDR